MSSHKQVPDLTEQQLKRQKKGVIITASIVGAVAFGVFLLTLYLSNQ